MKKTGSETPSEESGNGKAAPAEPSERARLQAEVAKQRVRIAKEELKRARKRLKEAKREARRARKQAASTRKVWKKARRAAAEDGNAQPPPRDKPQRGGKTAKPAPAKGKSIRAKNKPSVRSRPVQSGEVSAPAAKSRTTGPSARTSRVPQTSGKLRTSAKTRRKNATQAHPTAGRPTSLPRKLPAAPPATPVEMANPRNSAERPTLDSTPSGGAPAEQKP
jgi:hypothetical protein